VLAIVTRRGSTNSHTAILARTLQIPCVVNCDLQVSESLTGRQIAVDAESGHVYLDPEPALVSSLQRRQREEKTAEKLLLSLRGKPNVTLDGVKVSVLANVESNAQLSEVLSNEADGIGLFRSEFLYLRQNRYPTEEEQFAVYREAAEKLDGRPVTIRTMDIGADKSALYLHLPKETNPALGFRAIRFCLERPGLFKTQLRAIYRASAYGSVQMMIPMIICVEEIEKVRLLAEEVKNELREEGKPYQEIPIGAMIETPGAVLIADELAKKVDFFSVGTNDLAQYTLAMDRQNPKLDSYYTGFHPAIQRELAMVAESAAKAGIPASVCGEMAGEEDKTALLLSYGYRKLSVSPGRILKLRKIIRETSIGKA